MFSKKPAPASPISGDNLGPYPADVDNSPTRDKALTTALRSVSIVAIVSGCLNIALGMLIVTILPLQKVVPYLVTFKNQADQIVHLEPLETSAPGIAYATEANIRSYVYERHSFTPDKNIMDKQWGTKSKLFSMTGEQLYAEFKKGSDNELAKMLSAGYSRQIEINSVIQVADDIWQADFTTIDTLPGQGGTLTVSPSVSTQPAATTSAVTLPQGAQAASAIDFPAGVRHHWTAKLQVSYDPKRITYDQRLMNPLGFTVVAYSVTSRS